MLHFFVTLQSLLNSRIERDDKGATLVEYGLLVALIAVVSIAVITALGTGIANIFGDITAAVTNAI